MSKIFTTNELKNSLFILLGTLFIALSVVLFFLPNNFTTGGTPGMAILLHHLSGFSIGSMVIAINIPLLIWGTKYLGKKFAIKTIITIILISLFIDLFAKIFSNITITENILLASIFGGVIIGLGVGLIIKGNSSAGGSTIIARIISANSHIKPAQIILFIDVIIVICSIYVFKDIEKALWSIMSIYATSKSIDIVLTGTLSTKVIHIATNKVDELSLAITNHLGEEGTILKGSTLKTQDDKTLIFIVVDIKKIALLKEIIQQTDEEAFMIVMEASEMLGRGH
ncbi:YitT family protein [Arcobacter sp. LA11]|uniref:YitT family protein n=1 Tax=Arcobacter sp. LA11 TaxID=1898176 RepID=UPI00093543A2|nr:YitT family protein [Arcobacter sp. LA11]